MSCRIFPIYPHLCFRNFAPSIFAFSTGISPLPCLPVLLGPVVSFLELYFGFKMHRQVLLEYVCVVFLYIHWYRWSESLLRRVYHFCSIQWILEHAQCILWIDYRDFNWTISNSNMHHRVRIHGQMNWLAKASAGAQNKNRSQKFAVLENK